MEATSRPRAPFGASRLRSAPKPVSLCRDPNQHKENTLNSNYREIMNGEEVLRISLISAPDGRPLARRVFFDTDSWQLDEQFLPLVKAHAEYLRDNPDRVAVIAGHTQGVERQRRCWLVGERRSRAVARALLDAGVSPSQIAAISKGVEKPAVQKSGRIEPYRRRVNIEYVAHHELKDKLVLAPGAPAWWTAVVGSMNGPADKRLHRATAAAL
jgi:outer membrane protein OmpA-like peptidoglycan-associated protein